MGGAKKHQTVDWFKVSLPSLPVSDDQFTLASSNRHQTVHSLDASLHGLPHRDTRDDSRGLQTNTPTSVGTQGTLKRTEIRQCSILP